MSSAHLNATPPPRGDMGIGLCYSCLLQLAAAHVAGKPGKVPGFGQTLVPIPVPLPGGVAVAAVPACFDCLTEAAGAAQRAPLLVATGGVR